MVKGARRLASAMSCFDILLALSLSNVTFHLHLLVAQVFQLLMVITVSVKHCLSAVHSINSAFMLLFQVAQVLAGQMMLVLESDFFLGCRISLVV